MTLIQRLLELYPPQLPGHFSEDFPERQAERVGKRRARQSRYRTSRGLLRVSRRIDPIENRLAIEACAIDQQLANQSRAFLLRESHWGLQALRSSAVEG